MPIYSLDGEQPGLAASAWVAPCATLIGKVVLHDDASVWFGAVLRGDNEAITVGEGANVQDLAMLHTDIGYPLKIAPHCTIGHQAMLHGCTIGEGSLIGMGATVLNGAVIGRNCLIGAGALVPEGREIADNSLVLGAPCKTVRTLGEDDIARMRFGAQHYVENARRYAQGLRAIPTTGIEG